MQLEPTVFGWRDLIVEAVTGLIQRPGRSALTALGTLLGVGAFVAVLGITGTVTGQIGRQFSVLQATTVTVEDVGAGRPGVEGENPPVDFPADADSRIAGIDGVVAGGVYWQAPTEDAGPSAQPAAAGTSEDSATGSLPVYAASPGALQAMEPTLQAGVLYNRFHQDRAERVAVLGSAAARVLGIANLADSPAIFIGDAAFTVVGIVQSSQRLPEMLLGVMIPSSTALALYGPPAPYQAPGEGGAQMLIETRIGAADTVAAQAPLDLMPAQPRLLQAIAPPDPHSLQDAVGADLSSLFLLLAGLCLAIGAVGIGNATLVAVWERTSEIGLRRALGARKRHIAAQFLTEAGLLGALGGTAGTALGVASVLALAACRHWTALLSPAVVLPAPLIGLAAGLVAGLYPALRSASIEPLEALRR